MGDRKKQSRNRVSKDGKGLEKLVSLIYETLKEVPSAEITRNVKVRNSYGRLSEFDVIIKYTSMGLEMITAIECKDHKDRVSVSKIHDFEQRCNKARGIRIHRKVFVAVNGYQLGAKGAAKDDDIELYDLHEISPEVVHQWIDVNSLWAPFLDNRQFHYIHFYTTDGRTLIFNKAELDPQTPIIEPNELPFPLNDLVQAYAQNYEYALEQLDYISDELAKAPARILENGLPLAVVVPTGIELGEGEGFDVILNGKAEEIRLIEIMVNYNFTVSRSSNLTARLYKNSQSQAAAEVLSCQVGPMTLEFVRNTSNGQTKIFATDASGQTHEMTRKTI